MAYQWEFSSLSEEIQPNSTFNSQYLLCIANLTPFCIYSNDDAQDSIEEEREVDHEVEQLRRRWQCGFRGRPWIQRLWLEFW